ncbi:DUF1674 domain-containing protein [Lysobacter koreensis]|uniref:DUF1674 domain-containing protein n=1 Tax=Lysobacter koreensis TaxID=266122 RepID=A0ABW2YJF9_9GAMM
MIGQSPSSTVPPETSATESSGEDVPAPAPPATEHGGRDGPEPTRYGDWEKNGRCIDF